MTDWKDYDQNKIREIYSHLPEDKKPKNLDEESFLEVVLTDFGRSNPEEFKSHGQEVFSNYITKETHYYLSKSLITRYDEKSKAFRFTTSDHSELISPEFYSNARDRTLNAFVKKSVETKQRYCRWNLAVSLTTELDDSSRSWR